MLPCSSFTTASVRPQGRSNERRERLEWKEGSLKREGARRRHGSYAVSDTGISWKRRARQKDDQNTPSREGTKLHIAQRFRFSQRRSPPLYTVRSTSDHNHHQWQQQHHLLRRAPHSQEPPGQTATLVPIRVKMCLSSRGAHCDSRSAPSLSILGTSICLCTKPCVFTRHQIQAKCSRRFCGVVSISFGFFFLFAYPGPLFSFIFSCFFLRPNTVWNPCLACHSPFFPLVSFVPCILCAFILGPPVFVPRIYIPIQVLLYGDFLPRYFCTCALPFAGSRPRVPSSMAILSSTKTLSIKLQDTLYFYNLSLFHGRGIDTTSIDNVAYGAAFGTENGAQSSAKAAPSHAVWHTADDSALVRRCPKNPCKSLQALAHQEKREKFRSNKRVNKGQLSPPPNHHQITTKPAEWRLTQAVGCRRAPADPLRTATEQWLRTIFCRQQAIPGPDAHTCIGQTCTCRSFAGHCRSLHIIACLSRCSLPIFLGCGGRLGGMLKKGFAGSARHGNFS